MQLRTDDPTIAALFEAVYAAPDADEPRLVLADALMERGDVRGEFIALQLRLAQGERSAKQLERERTLLEEHWRTWLGGLPGLQRVELDVHRGLLRGGVYQPSGRSADSPLWRTVEWLRVVNPKAPRELGSEQLSNLRRLAGLDTACLSELLDGAERPRLEALEFLGPWLDGERGARERRMVQALVRFPALETLVLSPTPYRHHASHLAWLFESPIARHLRVLRLNVELPVDVSGLYDLLVANRLEALKLQATTRGLRIAFDRGWLQLELESEAALRQHADAVRNLLPRISPYPWRRFDVFVGTRRATDEELAVLGEVAAWAGR